MQNLFKLSFMASWLAISLFAVDFKQIDGEQLSRQSPSNTIILSYASIIDKAKDSVVNIATRKIVNKQDPYFRDPYLKFLFDNLYNMPRNKVERALGSGVIISADGYIVTNNHVVEGADKIIINLPGESKDHEAKVIGTDKQSDLAVIKIDAKNLKPISFFNSDNVRVGDVVFAIGNPFGLNETVTKGIVSALNRNEIGISQYEDYIQVDASINRGNSGGALINSTGGLIGINAAIISASGGNNGIGLAIPANMVQKIAKGLIENGYYERAYLGVYFSDLNKDLEKYYGRSKGALITKVIADSAAAKAKLKRGDLIIAINNKPVESGMDLRNQIASKAPNTKIRLTIMINKKKIRKSVVLGRFDKVKTNLYKGMQLEAVTQSHITKYKLPKDIEGLVVSDVKLGSEAYAKGINVGDVLVQIEDQEVQDIATFKEISKNPSKKRFFVYSKGLIKVVVL